MKSKSKMNKVKEEAEAVLEGGKWSWQEGWSQPAAGGGAAKPPGPH